MFTELSELPPTINTDIIFLMIMMHESMTFCTRHSGQHTATVSGLNSHQASNVHWWLEIARGEVPSIVVEAKPRKRPVSGCDGRSKAAE